MMGAGAMTQHDEDEDIRGTLIGLMAVAALLVLLALALPRVWL